MIDNSIDTSNHVVKLGLTYPGRKNTVTRKFFEQIAAKLKDPTPEDVYRHALAAILLEVIGDMSLNDIAACLMEEVVELGISIHEIAEEEAEGEDSPRSRKRIFKRHRQFLAMVRRRFKECKHEAR